MIMAMAVPVGAAVKTEVVVSEKQAITVMPYENIEVLQASFVLAYIKGKKPANVKTSNASIGKVEIEKGEYSGAPVYWIILNYRKYGTTTASFKCDGKTYKTKVLVHKYANPVSSIKVGNTTIKGSEFNDGNVGVLKKSKYVNKNVKVTINLKSGWKLIKSPTNNKSKIAGVGYNGNVYKNGSKIKILKDQSYAACTISFNMEHIKTGKRAKIIINLA